ncbi:3-phosphoshikimate 1-carboxyvinyltransferase [Mucisphaera calidilacus]|uniref:3-phosphoshikimate 1-carboxyvinyltransferase n=1 Tax=Mucisphaera calidilacus TaxID=2527982 RepID=A0A518BV08_9BACT|nr:3-phosphoshikimate 1-carboxyvinyltransferase [Mucisphaera calidilacus]QDU70820.1 3-phosphoshikimate 1-carboxyvinyltransferase [Mucisphaera calidilacus]
MSDYPRQLDITPIGRFDHTVDLPGSKSLTNRALLLAALSDGPCYLTNTLFADDTERMLEALDALGFKIEIQRGHNAVLVEGHAGVIPATRATLNLGNAGTAVRFLTAALTLGKGTYTVDGIERMRQRPIAQLVAPLRELGATINHTHSDGYPPLEIHANGLEGGELRLAPTLSSQYITALLQIGVYARKGLNLRLDGPITSRPYVAMTLGLLEHFEVPVEASDDLSSIDITPEWIRGNDLAIEPDASSASYFWAAAAITPGSSCTVNGLGTNSIQGDARFASVLEKIGARVVIRADHTTVSAPADGKLHGIDIDLNDMPDAAMTLAAIAPLLDGTTTIRNVGNWRVKETDRMAAMQTELNKTGAQATINGDDITIHPLPDGRLRPATIDTYDDHRMAMTFTVLGLAKQGVTINDPACVAKTLPDFFERIETLRTQASPAH